MDLKSKLNVIIRGEQEESSRWREKSLEGGSQDSTGVVVGRGADDASLSDQIETGRK